MYWKSRRASAATRLNAEHLMARGTFPYARNMSVVLEACVGRKRQVVDQNGLRK